MIELYSNGETVPVTVSKFPAGELYVKVGNIENVVFPHNLNSYSDVYVVDDICDGGAT